MPGFLQWSKEMNAFFSRLEVQPTHVLTSDGDGQWTKPGEAKVVVVLSNIKLTVRESGLDMERPLAQVFKVDLEEGVITEIRPFFWDVTGFNEALERKKPMVRNGSEV